ncbi:hypothetical protein NIES22_70530 (plasmid) [Calothrix brevissima NIES-22]|nr:hypothetical protein NIES22_70530 [Calothrix brevissima NIES-22]
MPLVVRDGKVVDTGAIIGSPAWESFLRENSSFRYETANHGGYTATKQNDYWYASRKHQGKLHRKYIGTTSELNINQLDAAAIALSKMAEQAPAKDKKQAVVNNHELQKQVTYLTEQVAALKEELADLRGKLAA